MKKTLMFSSFLMAITAGYASNVFAQNLKEISPKQILFKIHDIKPNKGEDGFVKSCDYIITFYNRTDSNIDSANIDLTWNDDTGNYIIEQNQKDIASELSEASAELAATEGNIKAEAKSINTFVDVPSILAYSQVSIASNLETEKCFLLLGDVKYTVTSCNFQKPADDEEEILPAGTRSKKVKAKGKDKAESCSRFFKFVSTQDPEYYKEFKPISLEEEEKTAEEKQIQALQDIAAKKDEIDGKLNKATEILGEIR